MILLVLVDRRVAGISSESFTPGENIWGVICIPVLFANGCDKSQNLRDVSVFGRYLVFSAIL